MKKKRDHVKRQKITLDMPMSARPIISDKTFSDLTSASFIVSASQTDWKLIEDYILDDPQGFALSFLRNGVNKALETPHIKPSSKQLKTFFKQIMTLQAFLLYQYLSYWFKQGDKPKQILTLISAAPCIIEISRSGKRGKPKPLNFTADCMDRIYKKLMKTHKMRAFRDRIDDFKTSYVHEGGKGLKNRNWYLLLIQNLSVLQEGYITKSDINGNENIFSILRGITQALLSYSLPSFYASLNAQEGEEYKPYLDSLSKKYPSIKP